MELHLESVYEPGLTSADWADLAAGVGAEHRFLNRNWYDAWNEAYLPKRGMKGPVRYLVTRNLRGTVLGALPHVVVRLAGLRILSLAGFYYDAPALRLGPVAGDDAAVRALVEALQGHGWSLEDVDHGAQQIVPLPPTFDEFSDALGRNLRRNLRKGVNRMRRDGKVELKAFRSLPASEWDRVVEDLARVEAHSWLASDSSGTPRFEGERNQRFWKRLLRDPQAGRSAGAWLLYFNGEAVAFSFAIDSGRCRYNFAGQHDETVDRYGTGWIVDRDLFEDAIDGRMKSVNLGDGWAHYKRRWGAISGAHLRDYLVFPPSTKGRLLHLAAHLRQRVAAWLR
jgi:hypothetical protein